MTTIQEKLAREKEKEEEKMVRNLERQEDMKKISEMILLGVKDEVENALQPVEERLDKQEEVSTDMARQFNIIMKELDIFRSQLEFPSLPELSDKKAFRENTREETFEREGSYNARSRHRVGEVEWESGDHQTVRNMCADARKVIGLKPIEPKMIDLQLRSFGAKTKEEAMLMEVKSYLKCEMKMLPSDIVKLDIVKIFHPDKDDWDVLYVQFGSEYEVDKVFSYTKFMKRDNRVIRWIPKKMYHRYSAVESYAYRIRKEENLKTRVKIGMFDFELTTRESSSYKWKKRSLPNDLPRIDVNLFKIPSNISSPPQGRPAIAEMLAESVGVINAAKCAAVQE